MNFIVGNRLSTTTSLPMTAIICNSMKLWNNADNIARATCICPKTFSNVSSCTPCRLNILKDSDSMSGSMNIGECVIADNRETFEEARRWDTVSDSSGRLQYFYYQGATLATGVFWLSRVIFLRLLCNCFVDIHNLLNTNDIEWSLNRFWKPFDRGFHGSFDAMNKIASRKCQPLWFVQGVFARFRSWEHNLVWED